MSQNITLHPNQCRAGRALVRWSQAELSQQCGMSKSTIVDFELGNRVLIPRTLVEIRRTLEAAGVVFVTSEGIYGAAVRCSVGDAR